MGERPLEAQSAGLERVGQVDGGNSVKIVDNLLPTNVLNRLGFPSNHDKYCTKRAPDLEVRLMPS